MESPINIADDKVKNLIIHILSREWPLSARQIYFNVKKEGRDVSYQAVFKALQHLKAEAILDKQRHNYSLDKTWLEKTASFYDKINKTYSGEYQDVPSQILNSLHLTLKYKTMYRSWMSALDNISKLTFVTRKDNYTGFATCDHLPWAFALGDKDHARLVEVFKKIKNMYVIYGYKNRANTLLAKYYHSLNKNAHFKYVKGCADGGSLVIGGNYISQTIVDPKLTKSVDKLYSKLGSLNDVNLKKLYSELFVRETDISTMVTRNPALAKAQKERIRSYFK